MVVRAIQSELPTHGVGDYLFTISSAPDKQVSNRKFNRERERRSPRCGWPGCPTLR